MRRRTCKIAVIGVSLLSLVGAGWTWADDHAKPTPTAIGFFDGS